MGYNQKSRKASNELYEAFRIAFVDTVYNMNIVISNNLEPASHEKPAYRRVVCKLFKSNFEEKVKTELYKLYKVREVKVPSNIPLHKLTFTDILEVRRALKK